MELRSAAFAALLLSPTMTRAAPPRAGWAAPELAEEMKNAGVIYVSDDGGEVIDLYTKAIPNKLVGQITSGLCLPIGITVDGKGTLYVANFYGACEGGPAITVYPAGATTPSKTIIDAMYDPIAVAVAPRNGALYATDEGHNVLIYDHAGLKVSHIVYPPGGITNGVAISPAGDLFISYMDATGWHIGRYDGMRRNFVDQKLAITYGGGLAFDAAGNLIAVDQRAGNVYVFAPGATAPSKTYGGFSDPYTIALDPDGKTLYVDDLGKREIAELDYPSGRKRGEIKGFVDNTFGLAVSAPTGASVVTEGR